MATKKVYQNSDLLPLPTGKTIVVDRVNGHQYKLPANMATMADRMYQIRQIRYAQKKIIDNLQEEETAIADYLIQNLPKSDATGVVGKIATATISSGKFKPRVVDWDAVWKYIVKNKAFDMVQRRLSEEAVATRWENGKQIPGIERYDIVTVSLTKI